MALTDKLTAIADAIREKTGKTDGLTLDAMPGEIEGIQTGGGGDTSQEDGIVTRTITSYRNDRITSVGTSAFVDCGSLADVYLPEVKDVNSNAFQRTGLTEITDRNFPKLERILGNYAFGGCGNLVYFQSSTWKSRNFSGRHFQSSGKLKKVDLSALDQIAGDTFSGCGNLETLIFRKTDGITGSNNASALKGTKIASGTGYIYVPSAKIEEYKATTNWANYAEQFRAIEDYPEICGVGV